MIIRGSEILSRSTLAPTLTSVASLSAISLHFMAQPLLDDGPLSSHSVPCPGLSRPATLPLPSRPELFLSPLPGRHPAKLLVRCQFLREALKPHRITLANVLKASYSELAILRI